jgi:hypothetical protein
LRARRQFLFYPDDSARTPFCGRCRASDQHQRIRPLASLLRVRIGGSAGGIARTCRSSASLKELFGAAERITALIALALAI